MRHARRPQGRSVAVPIAVAFLLTLVQVPLAMADAPTPQGGPLWDPGDDTTYGWGVGEDEEGNDLNVPTWLKDVMRDVFDNAWEDPVTNNSNSVRYGEGAAVVQVKYTVDAPLYCGTSWIGCANGNTKKIWMRKLSTWCDKLDEPVTGCWDAGRAAIHEIGHVSGYLDHYPTQSWGRSRMTGEPPQFGGARHLGRSDARSL